ncbi:MAG TPA: sigma-70 family RNA polymerase sigma factor [Fimbriiglobus sp.]|jgi:RNA polymerase sigma factor (sigma-70 family)|nr:sigma-70 family RNA polymerase sigma factor [Fimbriiglobus sp.]
MPLGSILRGRTQRDCPVPAAETDQLPDPDLLDRFARHDDQQAFAALVRRHGPPVLGVCRRVLRDPHAADDAFQATFMVLARKAHAIARPEALGSWLYGVALRVACKARAGASRKAPGPIPEPAADTPDPSAGIAGEELRLILDEELCRMPDRDRHLIVLVYLEGRTHDEAARAIGCPLGSMAWRLARARDDLRRRLARRGVGMGVGAILLLASVGRAQAVSDSLVGRVAGAAQKGPAGSGASTYGRRIPLGCLLPLGVLLVAGVATGGWVAAHGHKPPEPPAANHSHTPPSPTATVGHDPAAAGGGCGGAVDAP